MNNLTGAQGAVIARLLIEAYQSKGQRILEAGYTGQKKDKLGHTRYYANGRQVKNPNAKEKSAIHAAASTSLPAGQSPSSNDAATRVDALHADTPPEHVAALANDLMKMSVADLAKMAKAPAKSTPPSPQQQMLNSVGSSGKADGKRTLEKTGKLPHELTLNEFAAVVDPDNAKWQNKEDPSEQHLAWVKAAMVHEPEKVPASVLQMYADKDASISNELQSRSADKPAPKAAPAPAPAAGMSADANALDALRLKSNKKQHNPAHINPEALSSLKAQGFIDDKNKLTPAGRTHLYAEKLKGAPAPTGTAAATPAAPKPKWKRANRNKDSLISIVKRKGGINSKSLKTDYDYQADIIEGGLLHAIRKQGMGLDEMAASLQVEGHIVVPEGVDPGDYLLDRMKGRHHSALRNTDKEIESEQEAFYKAQHEAKQGGHDERSIEGSRRSGAQTGESAGEKEGATELDEWDNSGAGETGSGEKSGTVSGDGYDSADTDDYDRNAGQDGPVDNSFDFGANADEPKADEPAPAPTAAAPQPDDAVARHMQRQAFTGVDSQGRQWQNGELVAAKDDEPAPAGKAEPAPTPGDTLEKHKSNIDTMLGNEDVAGVTEYLKKLPYAEAAKAAGTRFNVAGHKTKKEVLDRVAQQAPSYTPSGNKKSAKDSENLDKYIDFKNLITGTEDGMAHPYLDIEGDQYSKENQEKIRADYKERIANAVKDLDPTDKNHQRLIEKAKSLDLLSDEPKAAPEPEKKSNKFENPGDVITPSSQSRTGENPLEVVSIKDGWALVGYANRPDGPRVRMPSESLDLFRQDQQGRVDLPDHTGSEAIDKISNGKGKLLGSGDDGFAYDAGDKVVKVSTTAHFHAFGHEHRSPAEAVHRLKGQAEINNDMIKAGVPGLLPQTFEEHGNRGFITMEKLDTTTKLTPEQVDEVARNLEAMHKLGYVLGDQIQVGIDFAGHPKIFDTGKAVKAGSGGYSKEDHIDYDNSNLERFFKDNGLTYEDPEQKKLTKLRDSTRAQIEKIKAAPKDIDQGKAQFLLHSFSLHLNLLAHQTGGVLYAYAMADDPDVKKLELIARHTIDTDSFHDKTVKKLKPMDAPAPAAAAPDQPGFTGTDAQGREWQDGKLVAAKDEPTKAPAANTDLFGNPSKATAPKGPETMPGLFGDAVPIAPDAPTAAAGEPLPGSDNPLDRAGAGRGRQDATQDMFGLFGPGTKAKIDQVNNGPDPDPVTEPSTPAAAAAEPQPNDTPRTVAARVSAAMADEFEGARNSTLPNMGQDTPGSARHKAMAWKGLKDAEANGTAEALVKRDELLKNDPSNLSSILAPENFLGVLTSHLTMQAFPKEVLTYAEYVKNEKHHVSTPAQLREQYYEAFTEIKKLTEDLSTKKLDPRVIASEVNKKINGLIEKFRKEGQGEPSARPGRRHDGDSYNPVANSLISMQKRVLGGGANSVVGRVNDFGKRLFTATGEMSYNSKEKAVSAVADILEGKSFNQAFDTVNQKKKEFDFNEAYGGEVTRTGGKKIDMSEQSTSSPGAKVFMDDMKVRGVQFGNSLPDQERVYHAQKSAEALSDLTSILGLPDEAAGLGGKLGLAIGARGKGGALAHFEPYQANDRHNPDVGGPVINLTRANGAGSLAHEWGHGLDHYAANNKAGGGKFLSHPEASRGGAGGSPETIEAMKKVQEAMGNSGFDNRLIDETVRRRFSGSRRQYWTSPEEKFARTFERHVQNKLHEAGRENTYLTGLHKQGHPLWPTNDEMAHMAPHMDTLIAAIAAEKFPNHKMPTPAPAAPKTAATKAPATEKATAAPVEEKPATAMAAWWQRGGNKNESPFASFAAIHGRPPTSEESQGQLDALDYIKGKFYPKAGQGGAPAPKEPAAKSTYAHPLEKAWEQRGSRKDETPYEAFQALHGRKPTMEEMHGGPGGLFEKLKGSKAFSMPNQGGTITDVTPAGYGPGEADTPPAAPAPGKFLRMRDLKDAHRLPPDDLVKKHGWSWTGTDEKGNQWHNGRFIGEEGTYKEAVMPATDPHAEKIKLIQAIIARRGITPPQPKAQAKKIPEASEDADPRVKRIRELMDAYC